MINNFPIYPVAPVAPSLQAVTDVGNTTTNDIYAVLAVLSAQNADGSSQAYLTASGLNIQQGATAFTALVLPTTLTNDRTLFLPDEDGTLATLADVSTPTLEVVTTAGNSTNVGIVLQDPAVLTYLVAGFTVAIGVIAPTANHTIRFKDASGTVALTSDIPATPTLQQVVTAGGTTTVPITLSNTLISALVNPTQYVTMTSLGWTTQHGGAGIQYLAFATSTNNRTLTFQNKTGNVGVSGSHVAVLVAGTVTVADPNILAGSCFGITYATLAIGVGQVSSAWQVGITAGVSYTITGLNLTGGTNASDGSSILISINY